MKKLSKRILLPNSVEYLELKAACLRGDYTNHFVEHNFKYLDNAEQIYLYEYCSYDFDDVQQICQAIKEDVGLFEHKECTFLFDVSDAQFQMEILHNVMNAINAENLVLKCGIKKMVNIKVLCC